MPKRENQRTAAQTNAILHIVFALVIGLFVVFALGTALAFWPGRKPISPLLIGFLAALPATIGTIIGALLNSTWRNGE